MELSDYLRVLRAHWVGIILITVLGAVVAFGWTFTQPKVYAANSSGIVSLVTASNDVGTTSVADSLAKSKAPTYVNVGESRAVAQLVIQSLGLSTSPETLVSHVTVTNVKDTPTIDVSATASTAQGAKDLADAWITALAAQIKVIETDSASPGSTSDSTIGSIFLQPVESAIVPTSPVSPNVKLAVALGALIGLILGLVYAVVRNLLDRRIRTSESIERQFGLSVIGSLPKDRRLDDENRIVPEADTTDYASQSGSHALPEALRELRTNLQFMNVDNPPRIIVVTSPLPNDGKSTVTANLAVTLAAAGQKVIVVDGDLRKPSVTSAFGIVPGVGITDLLIGKAEIQDVLQPWGTSGNLLVLGAGSIPPNPSELLGSQGMNVLLHELARDAMVLVDAPPLLPVTDAAVLSARTDGAIVVVSAGKTTTDELTKALANIAKTSGKTLGVILNRVPTKGALGRGYGYYYGSYYGKDSKKTKHATPRLEHEDTVEVVNNVVPIRTGTDSN
ncbi:polysaccharide biosynthesis tyrosine autokinase [Subtercola endophyticus]|uniref:polysaccharide biosynthesis tyrosine autokinase n=1 Tax=Subtercola endophyticus TaxID=2895559 RepID=UPI001E37656D|nr:polysaccharide biosynthesis tyrosine autokinase [Subtercola endophyticus]UFS57877.1 polysaccharide biosynthesis tyrosine autokinase [Subtercola endophyticus]